MRNHVNAYRGKRFFQMPLGFGDERFKWPLPNRPLHGHGAAKSREEVSSRSVEGAPFRGRQRSFTGGCLSWNLVTL